MDFFTRSFAYLYDFLPSVCVGALEGEEDDCTLWPEWDPCLTQQESPLEHCAFTLLWKHSFIFLSALTFLPFLTLDQCSCFDSFIPDFEVTRLDRLSNTLSLPFSSIFDNLTPRDVDSILGCAWKNTVWSCSDSCNLFLYKSSRRYLTLFPTRSAPILYRNLGRHHVVSKYWTNPSDLELYLNSGWLKVAIDHISSLLPSQESIVVLSSLLFDNYSSSERGTGNDLSRRRRNPRIKYLKIRKRLSFEWFRRQKIVYGSSHLHFIDPRHGEFRSRCAYAQRRSWSWLSSTENNLGLDIFRNGSPRLCTSAFPSYHFENKILQFRQMCFSMLLSLSRSSNFLQSIVNIKRSLHIPR